MCCVVLQWSDELLTPILLSESFPRVETHRELKEKLYYTMIEYFDKGRVSNYLYLQIVYAIDQLIY